MDELKLAAYRRRAIAFTDAAHRIFGRHEHAASSRVMDLQQSYDRLEKLTLAQDDLFRQALRCAEHELYRASHVMAWAGFMDFLEEQLAKDGLREVRSLRPTWKGDDIETMREYVSEYQLIEVTQPIGLCTKNQVKALLGLLNKRNECAHPSAYFPGLNETLGFIAELMQRVQQIQPKSLGG